MPVRRALLVGSWAIGRHTAASDVDILVVYGGLPRPDAYALCRKRIPVEGLEPHVYSEDEAAELGEPLERMANEGIDLLAGPSPAAGEGQVP